MLRILVPVLVVLAVVFALQNMAPVSLTFIVWQFQSPLAFVLLGAVGAGLLIAALAFMPSVVRGKFAISASKKHVSDLEQKLEASSRQRKPEKSVIIENEADNSKTGDNR